jgi:hypothetical protein
MVLPLLPRGKMSSNDEANLRNYISSTISSDSNSNECISLLKGILLSLFGMKGTICPSSDLIIKCYNHIGITISTSSSSTSNITCKDFVNKDIKLHNNSNKYTLGKTIIIRST